MKVVFGSMTFALTVDEDLATSMLQKVQEAGVTEVDTASFYPYKGYEGQTEEMLGRIFKRNESMKFAVATKANPWHPKGLSRAGVREQLQQSLKSMGLSQVDLFYLHAPDHSVPIEETLKEVAVLYQEGKFARFALSNYSSWQVADIVRLCDTLGCPRPSVYQGMYNAVTRDVERELLPCLRSFGISFYAYNPLAAGLLTGRYKREEDPSDGRFNKNEFQGKVYRDRFWKDEMFDQIDNIRTAVEGADAAKHSLTSAAFAWLRHHSALKEEHGDAIIVGASKEAHLISNLKDAAQAEPLTKNVVDAYDVAWTVMKPNCPSYFR